MTWFYITLYTHVTQIHIPTHIHKHGIFECVFVCVCEYVRDVYTRRFAYVDMQMGIRYVNLYTPPTKPRYGAQGLGRV